MIVILLRAIFYVICLSGLAKIAGVMYDRHIDYKLDEFVRNSQKEQ